MAIQSIELGVLPKGEGGDTPRSANTKINANFNNPAHAASRGVGLDAEFVPLSKNIPELAFTPLIYTSTTTNPPNLTVDASGTLKRTVGGYNRKRIIVAVNTSVTSQSIPTGLSPNKIIAVNVIARSVNAVIPINYGSSYQFKWSIYLTDIIMETTTSKAGLVGSNWIIDITYGD